MDFLLCPQEEEMLVSLLDKGQVLRDPKRSSVMWIPRSLKLVTPSASVLLVRMIGCVPPLVFLKSTMSSLFFFVLKARLLSVHHAARCSPPCRLTHCRCLSSANLIMVLEPCTGLQLEGEEEKRTQHTALWNASIQGRGSVTDGQVGEGRV